MVKDITIVIFIDHLEISDEKTLMVESATRIIACVAGVERGRVLGGRAKELWIKYTLRRPKTKMVRDIP